MSKWWHRSFEVEDRSSEAQERLSEDALLALQPEYRSSEAEDREFEKSFSAARTNRDTFSNCSSECDSSEAYTHQVDFLAAMELSPKVSPFHRLLKMLGGK